MLNNTPMIRKAFLATRNVGTATFLLTERFTAPDGKVLFFIIESENDKNGKSIQNHLQADLVKTFLASPSFSIMDFEKSLHYINQKIELIPSNKASALIGIVENNIIHLAMTGCLEGYLLRKGKINSVTEGLGSDGETGFFNITSGELRQNDLVIIGNKNLFNRLSLDRIRHTLTQFSPAEAVRDFYNILRKSKNIDCNALVFQATSGAAEENANNDLPELLYLDEIIESKFSKFCKKAKPVIEQYYATGSKIARQLFENSKTIAKSSTTTVKEKYAPKTKDLLVTTNSKAIEGFSRISGRIRNHKDVKIRPYNRSSAGNSAYLLWISKAFQAIFQKENRRYLYLGLIVILIFASYLKIRSNNINRETIKKQNEASFSYDKALETFQSAEAEISSGKSDGISKLSDALALANTARNVESTKDKAAALIKDINGKLDGLTKTKRLYDANPLFSFKYDSVAAAVAGSTIYSLTSDGKIYSSDTREKNPKLVAAVDSPLGKPISATYSDSSNILYILTDLNKVWAYDPQAQSGAEIILDDGAVWEPSQAISTYSSSIYLLDSAKGKIWRHSKSGNSYSAGTSYAGGKNTDAKDGISFAIDGSIYVLKNSGSISKFTHSALDSSFVLQSPPGPSAKITQPKQLCTDADSQNLFILDQAGGRILRFAKDGQFASQYVIDNVLVTQILVNSRLQKMWAISGKDVYELDL